MWLIRIPYIRHRAFTIWKPRGEVLLHHLAYVICCTNVCSGYCNCTVVWDHKALHMWNWCWTKSRSEWNTFWWAWNAFVRETFRLWRCEIRVISIAITTAFCGCVRCRWHSRKLPMASSIVCVVFVCRIRRRLFCDVTLYEYTWTVFNLARALFIRIQFLKCSYYFGRYVSMLIETCSNWWNLKYNLF